MPTGDWSAAANRRLLLAPASAGLGALIGPLNCDVRALVLLHENQTKMSYGTHMLPNFLKQNILRLRSI